MRCSAGVRSASARGRGAFLLCWRSSAAWRFNPFLEQLDTREFSSTDCHESLLIDIRPVAQRAQYGVIPSALCIERNVLEWRLDPQCDHRLPGIGSYERRVIIVCQQGYASSFAAASLRLLGYEQAGDVQGGFDAWRSAGLPVHAFES